MTDVAPRGATSTRAFTIIELLVVIAIISLLTGIIMTNLTSAKAKARDAKRVSDMGQIQLALELYFDRCGEYPDQLGPTNFKIDLGASNGCPSGSGITMGSFLPVVPTRPPGANPQGEWYDEFYFYKTDNSKYVLRVALEGQNQALVDDIDDNVSSRVLGIDCRDEYLGTIVYYYCIISD